MTTPIESAYEYYCRLGHFPPGGIAVPAEQVQFAGANWWANVDQLMVSNQTVRHRTFTAEQLLAYASLELERFKSGEVRMHPYRTHAVAALSKDERTELEEYRKIFKLGE